ncbi:MULTISPECIES: hypothetical protein [unclassified Dietzia]|uniref:hypothetical protein n=1 Tax=unclassified Dietzia TaxID=2617939 RepID=UPI0015FA032E|nr:MULTISPECIES: hypothetical protein [unclassified Dietzia]MBB1022951.1 hypothetical protein [Dietzia sp. DQ12-76]MBB1026457.1 hypothetical protein [Dietzia sp. DQ11-38-2]
MTDSFLEPHQVDELGGHWHTLAGLIPQLDDLLAGSVMGVATSLGIRIARAPASRPPINVAAYDHLDLIRACAEGWTHHLATETNFSPPRDTSTAGLCRHLHLAADRIATRPWAPDCLDEATELASTAARITNPDDGESITDRHHLATTDVHHRAHQAQGDAADMAAVHHAVTGEHLDEKTIHQWRRRGHLPERIGPAGEVWFHYHEVAAAARHARIRRLPIRQTSRSNRRP